MLGGPAARHNVLYSEYDASGEAICQIILPPGCGPPTWPLDKGHYWLRQVDMHNEADSSGNTDRQRRRRSLLRYSRLSGLTDRDVR
jgi:hypothetical protein